MKNNFLRHFIFLFFLFAKFPFAFSQENIDSLKFILAKCESDSNKVNVLNRLSWNLRSINPTEALTDAEFAKSLAMKINFEKGTATSYNNIGVIEYRRGEYPEAVAAHFQALSIREKIGDKEGIALSEINIGNVYSDQNNNGLALKYYFDAEKVLCQTSDSKRLLLVYLNIGEIFIAQNKISEGLNYSQKAKTLAQQLKNKTIESEAWNNIGVANEYQNQLDEAMFAYKNAYSISESLGDKTNMVDNMINIGDIFRLQKKYQDALEWHDKTEILAREIGYLEGLRVLYENYSKDYQAMGNFELALNYHIRFKNLNDSLFNADNTDKINEITNRWETDRKQKNLFKQQEELIQNAWIKKFHTQKLWLIAGAGFAIFIFLGYIFNTHAKVKLRDEIIKTQNEIILRQKKNE